MTLHRLFDKYGPQPVRECNEQCAPDIGMHVHIVWTTPGVWGAETEEEREDYIAQMRLGLRLLNHDLMLIVVDPLDPTSVTPYPDTPDRYTQPWRVVTAQRSMVQAEVVQA